MTYDHWKTTNPMDEYLGPEPPEEEPDPVIGDVWHLKLAIDAVKRYPPDQLVPETVGILEALCALMKVSERLCLHIAEEVKG